MQESELTIDRIGFPPFSTRNCTQTLSPLPQGELRRTLNGRLIYTGDPSHHKFQSSLQCQDKIAPALESIWRGSIIKIGCLQRLSQRITSSTPITLQRDPVEKSVVIMDCHHQEQEMASLEGRIVTLKERQELQEELYVSYRPYLEMCVVSYKLLTDEWGFSVGWQIDLEEV